MPKSSRIDERFDKGESVLKMIKKGGKVEAKHRTTNVNVTFPTWMVEALDEESLKLNINRQAVIKMLLNEALHSKGYRVSQRKPIGKMSVREVQKP